MNLREYVHHKQLRIYEIAFLMGVPSSRISELLHGVRPLTLPIAKKLVAISQGLITFEDLAEEEVKRKVSNQLSKKKSKGAAKKKQENKSPQENEEKHQGITTK